MTHKPSKVISDAEIAAAAKAGGFSGDDVVTVVAIALAESSGNIYAHNPVPPDNSYGLMQINMLGDMGPERRKRYGLKSNDELFYPVTNMRAAYDISHQGRSFTPQWSTHTSGAYRLYLNRARKASGSPASEVPKSDGGTVRPIGLTEGVDELGKALDFLTAWQTWARLGMIVGGGILMLVTLSAMTGTTNRVTAVATAVTDKVPQVRAAKALVKGK